jgi:hypothetical protein
VVFGHHLADIFDDRSGECFRTRLAAPIHAFVEN